MNEKTIKVVFGTMLHDIGKLICRAGLVGDHNDSIAGANFLSTLYEDQEVIAAVRYHHKAELAKDSPLTPNSPAYITYIADHIAEGYNCSEDENATIESIADRMRPISAIFNLLHGRNASFTYGLKPLSKNINYPMEGNNIVEAAEYESLVSEIKEGLSSIDIKEQSINSLLTLLEGHLSYVPSSTISKDIADISLYDHSKITAAFGSCISEYLQENGITDYRSELFVHEASFLERKAFLLLSGDFSGIQSFIFNVVTEDALKRLRSRSFFLEMLMEHIVDWILASGGVSRANLIYGGGGHCYILLPNTETVIRNIEAIKKRLNSWLRKNFGTGLYFACAYTECSANDLMNKPAVEAPYEQIFRSLSKKLSNEKLHRYSAQELMELNQPSNASGARECRICGTETDLCKEDNICAWCDRFLKISSRLLDKELIIIVLEKEPEDHRYLLFPKEDGEEYYYLTNKSEAKKLLEAGIAKRIYTKNRLQDRMNSCTNLFMGDYVYDTRTELLLDEDGLKRLAVLRADVDNFGQAFISGFVRQGDTPEQRNRYNTLTRTAALSRQMTMFFKYYLNIILEGKEGYYSLDRQSTEGKSKRVVTVYSGGDDLFLIGNFRDIIESAIAIRNTFDRYTCGSLTISFGIGIYLLKYPLYKAAYETEDLENLAKNNDGKNSISLFSIKEEQTYRFNDFKDKVIEEKLNQLQTFFGREAAEQEKGNAFLYKMLMLLKASNEKINIARYAYLLSSLEPKKKASNGNREQYESFLKKMYSWILDPKDRKTLITAIYIYIYLARNRSDN